MRLQAKHIQAVLTLFGQASPSTKIGSGGGVAHRCIGMVVWYLG